MTSKKTTRRALFSSVMALILCCAMLVGSTFAWFTDSVSSVNNVITAGNLDVELYYMNDTTSGWTKVGEDTNIFKQGTLWEPGHTEVIKLKVVNAGTLALKYQLGINVFDETGSVNKDGVAFKLSDYIYFGVVEGDQSYTRDAAVAAVEGSAVQINKGYTRTANLSASDGSTESAMIVTVVVYMPESVGNEANYGAGQAVPQIDLGINLFATQVEAEFDSFGNDYDAKAWDEVAEDYETSEDSDTIYITNAPQLAQFAMDYTADSAQFDGKTISITADIDLSGRAWTPMKTWDSEGSTRPEDMMTVEGNGHSIIGLTVNGGSNSGFFGNICDDITINNLTFVNPSITSTGSFVGVVVGQQYGDLILNDVDVNGGSVIAPIDENSKRIRVGGLVGQSMLHDGATLSLTGCDVDGMTIEGWHNVGGLVGSLMNYTTKTDKWEITDCTVKNTTIFYGSDNVNHAGYFAVDGATFPADRNETFTGATATNTVIMPKDADGLAQVGTTVYVYNAEGLSALNSIISKNVTTVELMADIDMTDYKWNMVDMHADAQGKLAQFNGNGHTISNMTIDGAAMFSRIATGSAVTFKDVTFDNVTVNSTSSNSAVITKQVYADLTLDNVDVKNSNISGETKVAVLVGTVFNERTSTVTLTVKNCDITDCTVTGKPEDKSEERLAGMVAWVADKYSDEAIVLENNTMTNVTVVSNSNAAEHHAIIYISDKSASSRYGVYHNEDAGVTVTNCTYTREVSDGLSVDGNGNFYVYTAEGLKALNAELAANRDFNQIRGKSYNIMADIDATGITWESVPLTTGSVYNSGIVFNGNGYTISNLTITGGGLFNMNASGSDANAGATVVKDLTLSNADVTGGYHVGAIWGQAYCKLTLENVHVMNSNITGTCNVGGLVGRNGDDAVGVITFKNCSVAGTSITATGNGDPNGASALLGSALKTSAASAIITFENCSQSGNTMTSADGQVGGGVYATWDASTDKTSVVNDFTNHSN